MNGCNDAESNDSSESGDDSGDFSDSDKNGRGWSGPNGDAACFDALMLGVPVGWVHLDIGDGKSGSQILCCPEEHPRKKYRKVPSSASAKTGAAVSTVAGAAAGKSRRQSALADGGGGRGSGVGTEKRAARGETGTGYGGVRPPPETYQKTTKKRQKA